MYSTLSFLYLLPLGILTDIAASIIEMRTRKSAICSLVNVSKLPSRSIFNPLVILEHILDTVSDPGLHNASTDAAVIVESSALIVRSISFSSSRLESLNTSLTASTTSHISSLASKSTPYPSVASVASI